MKASFKKLLAKQPRRAGSAQMVLAFLVIAIVAMMIVPLPTWLVDVLISTNLGLTVAILLVVLFVPDALAIATFPTLLLLTTLFRLALNVSSTRLILLQANAGAVIRAFGTFVVRGNYVVGGIIFLVLTIILFLVVAKGSERVAEIGCRFTLDAMPGKQMAIDAELRTGSIDGPEARRRRRALSRESQFFGAMDGALKYVKGDVIASIIIAVINILGGLVIGVAQRHMSVGDALKRYGLLTIGDGLVSQIPALVLATAAGLLVTRTASEEPDTPLGEELSRQLFGIPRALQFAAFFLVLLAAVPGLPALPFLVLAALLVGIAHARTKALAAEKATIETAAQPGAGAGGKGGANFIPRVVPWSVEVSEDLARFMNDEPGKPGIRTRVVGLRDLLFAELGVPLPPPQVRLDVTLPPKHAVISLYEVPEKVVALADEEAIGERLARECHALLRRRASDFIGLHETQKLLDQLEEFAPAVVKTVVPKPVSLTLLTDVLRRLVDEGVCVRDLRMILETVAIAVTGSRDPVALADTVRGRSARMLTHRLTRGATYLNVVLLDPAIEKAVLAKTTFTPEGQFITLAPDQVRVFHLAIRRALSECAGSAGWDESRPVILTTEPKIRRQLRMILASQWPNVCVTTYTELLPDIALRQVARAHLNDLVAA
jgi:type III secretion protein V